MSLTGSDKVLSQLVDTAEREPMPMAMATKPTIWPH